MLPKFMSPFRTGEPQPENKLKKKVTADQKRNSTSCSSSSSNEDDDRGGGGGGGGGTDRCDDETAMDVIGLRLVTQIITNPKKKSSNKVVVKSSLIRKSNLTISTTATTTCFLKTCSLCNKILSPDKDIYMYRGDQGFCSIECRNRQIVMDEMRELEESTKQIRDCWNDAPRRRLGETRRILEDIRLHRLQSNNKPIPSSCAHHHQNHWAIVS